MWLQVYYMYTEEQRPVPLSNKGTGNIALKAYTKCNIPVVSDSSSAAVVKGFAVIYRVRLIP